MKIKIEPQAINVNIKTEKIYPDLEDLEVTPSGTEQHFKSEKYGFDNVTVKAVESKELNIMPNTENQIKEGMFNKVTVAGDSDLISENIKEDVEIFGVKGTARLRGKENAVIDSTLIIDGSAIYNALTEISDINVSGVSNLNFFFKECSSLLTIPLFDTKNITSMQYMFQNCAKLNTIPQLDTSNVTDMYYMFINCSSLPTIPLLDTSNVTIVASMFSRCYSLKTIPLLEFGKVNNANNLLYKCSALTDLRGFKNLGKAYTEKTNNYANYTLNLSYSTTLTHESLTNVINNLYDLNLAYDVANGGTLYTQQLILGSKNLAKLTADEIAIATNKRLDCFLIVYLSFCGCN